MAERVSAPPNPGTSGNLRYSRNYNGTYDTTLDLLNRNQSRTNANFC
jgi:hypothetical protein